MGMGVCKPNCCFEKRNTFSLQIEPLENNQAENIVSLVKGKTSVMRTVTKSDVDDSNFTSLVNKY